MAIVSTKGNDLDLQSEHIPTEWRGVLRTVFPDPHNDHCGYAYERGGPSGSGSDRSHLAQSTGGRNYNLEKVHVPVCEIEFVCMCLRVKECVYVCLVCNRYPENGLYNYIVYNNARISNLFICL